MPRLIQHQMIAASTQLLYAFLVDLGIQFVFYIISASLKTEKFYDVSGMLTYISIVVTLLVTSSQQSPLAARQIILAAMTLFWTLRLGVFLFIRVLGHKDARFDELKLSFVKFSVPWVLQVAWIFLTALPVYIIIANPGYSQRNLIASDIVGIILWVGGLIIEITADVQKQNFKKIHPNDFVFTGIWAYSRYANYFGEVTLWFGVFVIACAGVVEDWQWVMVISPVFVTFLIVCISGVALSEVNAQKRYGYRISFND